MTSYQKRKSTLTTLKSFSKRTLQVIIITLFISSTYSNMYGMEKPANNNNISTSLESISLKGYYENQSDLLQWEVTYASAIAYFTIESTTDNGMVFNDVVRINPLECIDLSAGTKSTSSNFKYKLLNDDYHEIVYYKIRVTFQDNHTMESNFVSIRKTESVTNLAISDIKTQNGQIALTFKSPKVQNVILNVWNKSGQLLDVKNITAVEGNNTYSFDSNSINTAELLIISLYNQEEQTTKKYLLASAR